MNEFPAEQELLCATLRQHVTGDAVCTTLEPLARRVNWDHVLWLARQHRVLLVLADRLKKIPFEGLCPPAIMAQLTALRDVSQLGSLARSRETCQLQDLFDRHAIPAIATDAWMAAHACGAGTHHVESTTTLHYIVPAAELERATAVLDKAGHPSHCDPGKLIKWGCSPVRLNSGLGKRPAAERFWKDAMTFELGGRTHRHLAFGHWLLVQTDRLARSTMSLGGAHEVALLSRQIAAAEWPGVLAEAVHFRLDGTLAKVVAASHSALGLPTPEGLPTCHNLPDPFPSPATADPQALPSPRVSAPFLPTPHPVAERMLKLAGIGPDDVVCDLGCGDGRIAIRAAKDFGARGRGIDRNPVRIAEATARAVDVSDRVTFECGDLFSANIADATVVTCYLLPQLQPPLLEKLRREARPGTRIVSHDFTFPGWPPEKTEIIRTGPLKVSHIYLWRMP